MSAYPNLEKIKTVCDSFIGQEITLSVLFMSKNIPIAEPDIVGKMLENIFFPFFQESCPDLEINPIKQTSPDYYGLQREFQFEMKAFLNSPGFDISNCISLMKKISEPGGLIKKLFKTKYIIFEYSISDIKIKIKNYWLIDIWHLPTYSNTYPISLQNKSKQWYNFRPGPSSGFSDKNKTPKLFIDKLLECIKICPNLNDNDKESCCISILSQVEEAKIQGFL